MIKDYAKFSATIAKGIKVGDADVEVKLLVPLRVMQENFLFLSSNQGKRSMFSLVILRLLSISMKRMEIYTEKSLAVVSQLMPRVSL